jgi:hypothetical protein
MKCINNIQAVPAISLPTCVYGGWSHHIGVLGLDVDPLERRFRDRDSGLTKIIMAASSTGNHFRRFGKLAEPLYELSSIGWPAISWVAIYNS